ncbi:hypothetical protein DFH09DRAFT_1105612 [Mycena vulgaris]|nr:hypothetical protein DFH09DRAFT_1105612 [Mycena vulgaris]
MAIRLEERMAYDMVGTVDGIELQNDEPRTSIANARRAGYEHNNEEKWGGRGRLKVIKAVGSREYGGACRRFWPEREISIGRAVGLGRKDPFDGEGTRREAQWGARRRRAKEGPFEAQDAGFGGGSGAVAGKGRGAPARRDAVHGEPLAVTHAPRRRVSDFIPRFAVCAGESRLEPKRRILVCCLLRENPTPVHRANPKSAVGPTQEAQTRSVPLPLSALSAPYLDALHPTLTGGFHILFSAIEFRHRAHYLIAPMLAAMGTALEHM